MIRSLVLLSTFAFGSSEAFTCRTPLYDIRLVGVNLGSFGTTQQQCCDSCYQNPSCQGYTLFGSQCTLWSNVNQSRDPPIQRGAISAMVDRSTTNPPFTTPPPPVRTPPPMVNGQAVMCAGDQIKVYRYSTNPVGRRHYPTPEIATSWDPQWSTQRTTIDCARVPEGPPLRLNPATLREGQSIKCDEREVPVYRYTNGTRRWYPNPAIASSWNPNWSQVTFVECSVLPQGPDMAMK